MNTKEKLQIIQQKVDLFLTRQPEPQSEQSVTTIQESLNQDPSSKGEAFSFDDGSTHLVERFKNDSFSIFDPKDSKHVAGLFTELKKLVDEQNVDEDELDRLNYIIEAAQTAEGNFGLKCAQSALRLFIIHEDVGRRLTLTPFLIRHDYLLNRKPQRELFGDPNSLKETVLNWFREDLFLAEHHEHWHDVYPSLNSDDEDDIKDRQGEFFLYMHQQMLARYDTERIASGLKPVDPFPKNNFSDEIQEGYDPGLSPVYGLRLPKERLPDPYTVKHVEIWDGLIKKAIQKYEFKDENSLGNTIDANAKRLDKKDGRMGDLHDTLHSLIATISYESKKNGSQKKHGVMKSPETSANDPVFYRWHRYIDDLSVSYQEEAHKREGVLKKKLPDITIRSKDIILCFENDLDNQIVASHNIEAKDYESMGELLFGGDQWDMDFSSAEKISTSTLFTHMDSATVELSDRLGSKSIDFLDQKYEFIYFIRVQNNCAEKQQIVTVRLWLAAEELAHDRRMWIEMDTFSEILEPLQKKVIYRPANMSSVVKKSGGKASKVHEMLVDLKGKANQKNSADYCDCGWPYNLYLPKGTTDGMEFRFLAMITGDDLQMEDVDSQCGSVSFCGIRNKNHPDKMKLGYPFNRPFSNGLTPEQFLVNQENTAVRGITIKFCN